MDDWFVMVAVKIISEIQGKFLDTEYFGKNMLQRQKNRLPFTKDGIIFCSAAFKQAGERGKVTPKVLYSMGVGTDAQNLSAHRQVTFNYIQMRIGKAETFSDAGGIAFNSFSFFNQKF